MALVILLRTKAKKGELFDDDEDEYLDWIMDNKDVSIYGMQSFLCLT